MANNSKIEWTEHTDNLWHGCTKVHAGCDHCYAETLSHRWGRDIWGNDKPRMEIKSLWKDLWKQQQAAEKVGEMHRVFVGSMMDIFEKSMPLIDNKGNKLEYNTEDIRNAFFEQITEGYYPNIIFIFLTKRPSNINKYIPEEWKEKPPGNVMFGTSPCDQTTADTLISQLLEVKGKKFLSVEPMLGPVDLTHTKYRGQLYNALTGRSEFYCETKIDWVIVGGESGHHKRSIDLAWAREIRDDCRKAGIPFFMKQIDKVQSIPDDLMIREFPWEIFIKPNIQSQ